MGPQVLGMLPYMSLNMFDILLKHIIAEQAIGAMFNGIISNFGKMSFSVGFNVGDIISCSYIDGDDYQYVSHGKVTNLNETTFTISVVHHITYTPVNKKNYYLEYRKIHYSHLKNYMVLK